MGLGIVKSMLEAHGGRIALLPSTAGATFELTVPLLRSP
jgi:signal transduction histidine kinase